MHGPIFAILVLVLSATATAAIAQGMGQETLSADPRTRCAEFVAFWQRHGGSKSEGGGGGDIARKNAEVDCGAGAFHTATGGEILIVQYPGPSTGERPIYAGRFNMAERKSVAEERVDL